MGDYNSGSTRNNDSSGVVHTLITGNAKVNRRNKDCSRVVLSNSGKVVLDQVEGHGQLDEESIGGKECAMSGEHSDDIKRHAIDKVLKRQVNTVKVSLKFSDRSKRFHGEYELDETIYDVIADVVEKTDKKISAIQHTKTKEIMDDDVTVEKLMKEDYLQSLTAVLE